VALSIRGCSVWQLGFAQPGAAAQCRKPAPKRQPLPRAAHGAGLHIPPWRSPGAAAHVPPKAAPKELSLFLELHSSHPGGRSLLGVSWLGVGCLLEEPAATTVVARVTSRSRDGAPWTGGSYSSGGELEAGAPPSVFNRLRPGPAARCTNALRGSARLGEPGGSPGRLSRVPCGRTTRSIGGEQHTVDRPGIDQRAGPDQPGSLEATEFRITRRERGSK